MENRSIKKDKNITNLSAQLNRVKPVDYYNANNNLMRQHMHGNIQGSRTNTHMAQGFTDQTDSGIVMENVTEEGLPFQEWAEKYHQ